MSSGLPKPCVLASCGELHLNESRCDVHQAELLRQQHRDAEPNRNRLSPRERGYDEAWRRLSARARRMQPWCSDCGRTDDLTTDHLPSAWERKAQGKPIRLEDVDVLCRPCNADAGSSRPGSSRALAEVT